LIRDKLTVLNRMKCQRKVEYRLYPSPNQAAELARMSDTCRKVYNWALAERREYFETTGKSLSFAEQCRRLTVARRENFAWKAVHTHALQMALKRLDLAFGHFFRRVKTGEKPGYPRFKSKDRFSGFGFKEHGNGWRLEHAGKVVRITGIGRVKLRGKARFDGGEPRTCEVIQRAGKWYLSVTFTLAALPERKRTGEIVSGLDWGVETFATLANSDGTSEEIANPRHLRRKLDRLAAEQQTLARKQRGSKRRHLAKQRGARLHEKVRRQRQDFLHQTTAKLAASRRVIAVEKLSPLVMSAAGGATKAGLNREILAAAAGAFHSMLAYKAEEAGSTIIEIDPRLHRPSQTCSGGGPARKKSLSERAHVLPDGSVISRDLNAARNLLNLALGREPTQHSGPGTGPDTGCETATIAA
jgi:putative transposase